jgi:hypothetical protein
MAGKEQMCNWGGFGFPYFFGNYILDSHASSYHTLAGQNFIFHDFDL